MSSKKSPAFKELSKHLDKKQQGRLLTALTELSVEGKTHKIRFLVYSDSYDFQSYARAEIFHPTELQWNALANLPYSRMASTSSNKHGLYAEDATLNADFQALQKDVLAILT